MAVLGGPTGTPPLLLGWIWWSDVREKSKILLLMDCLAYGRHEFGEKIFICAMSIKLKWIRGRMFSKQTGWKDPATKIPLKLFGV
jgi:hypothetical protein